MINKPVRECPVGTTKTQVEFVFLCLGPGDDYSAFSKCCGQVAPNSPGQTVHIITNDDKKGSETKYITLHLCITVVSNEFSSHEFLSGVQTGKGVISNALFNFKTVCARHFTNVLLIWSSF